MRITKGYNPNTQLFTGNCSSVGNLNPIINVNSLDGTTVLRYNGKYANISYMRPWGYGEVLPIASSGTDPTFGAGSPLLGSVDDSIKFNAGDVFQAGNNTFADITTEDFYISCFFKTPTTLGTEVGFAKRGAANGWDFFCLNSGFNLYIDGTVGEYIKYSFSPTPNAWYFVEIFYDSSETSQVNGMQIYVNGINDTTYAGAVVPASIGSITNADNFTIGANSSLTQKFNGNIAYILMAKRSSWFAGGAQNLTDWAALHKERFAQISGIYPQIADNDAVYTSYTRSSPAFLRKTDDDGYVSYHQMGAGWPRVEKNKDDNGNIITGLLEEASGTNYCLRSNDLSNWTNIACDAYASTVSPLDGFITYEFRERVEVGDTEHYITSPNNALSDMVGQIGFAWVIVAPGSLDRPIISFCAYCTSATAAVINIVDNSFGAMSDNILDYGIENIGTFGGKDWKLVWMKFTVPGGAGNNYIRIYSSLDPADLSYPGTGETCFYLAHAQLEIGANLSYFSSPILTTTASVTRTTDSTIPFIYSNTLTQGSKVFDFYKQFPPSANTNIFSITNGTSDNMIYAYVDKLGYVNAEIISSTLAQGRVRLAIDICDGEKKRVAFRWNENMIDVLIYDYKTREVTQSSGDVTDIPLELTTNNFLVGDFIISDNKDYEYYEGNSGKLLSLKDSSQVIYPVSQLVSSVANLEPTINVNDLDGTTVLRYKGGDANILTWPAWTYGETLGIASSGTNPTFNDGSPLLGSIDDSVKYNAGDVHQASANTFADITTEDFYFSCFIKLGANFAADGNRFIFGKRYAVAAAGAWSLHENSTNNKLVFYLSGAVNNNYVSANTLTAETWQFVEIFYDASETSITNGLVMFVNGVQHTNYSSATTPAEIGSITNVYKFTIGDSTNFGGAWSGNLAYLLMAKRSNWFAGGATNLTQWAAIHKERFAKISGIYPQLITGASDFTSFSRSSLAFLRKADSGNNITYHQMGAGWPRLEKSTDDNNIQIIGLLDETESSNYGLYSLDLTNWQVSNTTTASSITGPIHGYSAYACTESSDGGATTHYVRTATNTLVDSTGQICIISIIAAPGVRPYARYLFSHADGAMITVDFNFSAKTITYVSGQAILDSGTKDIGTFGGKLFTLYWIKTTSNIIEGNTRTYFYPQETSGGATSYTGSGSTNFYLALSQLEIGAGLDHFSSPIITTTATVTRTTDSALISNINYSNGQVPYLWFKFDSTSGSTIYDNSGNSRNQTLTGSAAAFWVAGKYGNCGYFNSAVPNYISLSTSYFDGTKGTWGCWIKKDWSAASASNSRLIGTDHTSGINYESRTSGGTSYNGYIGFYTGNGSTYSSSIIGNLVPYNNIWVHILWTWEYLNGITTIKGYLNGILVTSSVVTITGPLINPTTSFDMCKYTTSYFTGYIDDFIFYQEALTENEIYSLYESNPFGIVNEGSKVFDFFKYGIPATNANLFNITDGTNDNRIYAYLDTSGYLNVIVYSLGTVCGSAQIATNICTGENKRIAVRWNETTLDILIYDYNTLEIETATGVLTDFPNGILVNSCNINNAIIGNVKDYNYYKEDNNKLLFD